jgi:Carboxypeptidase regulatory-like domain/TonB dependent receptor
MLNASGPLRTRLSYSLRMGFSILLVAIAFLFLNATLLAQSTTDGAIGGTVFDQNDAAVAGATVVVRNIGTNAEFRQTTNESGYFRVTGLAPANYSVTITAAGFSGYRAESVTVAVGRVTELSPQLGVAGTVEKVVVTGEAPEVNTTSPDFAPTLNQVAIQNLPINGGRWSNFVLLTPGVNNNLSGFGLVSFRGISSLLNNNTIDGADNNQAFFSEERGRTRAGYSSPKIAVQEFQVNTSDYSAEYGRAAGGVVNTVTKSGTNQFHGDAYFYDRDSAWAATNPYTTLTKQTSPGVFTTSPFKPTDIRKIWGGDIGGPIIKDKLFFFLAYDNYGRNFPGTAVATSPSAFFATPTTATIATLASRLGVSAAQATTDYNNGLNGLLTMLGPVARTGNQNITLPKIDWVINDKNTFSGLVNRMRWSSPAGIQTQSSNTFGIASFGNDYVSDTWIIAKLNSLITTHISNQLRYQWGNDNEWEYNQTPTPYEQSTLVTPAGYSNPLGLPPQVTITNGFTFGVPSFLNRPKYPNETRNQVADTVTWITGKHTFKFGGDYNHVNDDTANLRFQYGGFSYSSLLNYFSDLYGTNTCTATVSGKVVHVPCYSSYTQAFGPLGANFNTNDLAFFAEDSFKVSPRLTLNLGLRWEYEMLPDAYLVNSLAPQTANSPADKNNFGPRVGFAYDIFGDGTTSLRGGWGMYYGRIINSAVYNALLNTGVAAGQLQYNFTATQGGPIFPQIIDPATPPTGSLKPSIVYFDRNFQAPEIQQIDLIFERQLGWNTTLTLSYLGSLGRQLPNFVDTNLTTTPTTIKYAVIDPNHKGPVTSATLTGLLFNSRPNANFGSMTDIFSGVNSSYNAFAVQVNHNMSHYVQFSANYTWAHALDYGQNEATFTDTNDLLNPYCLKCEYGNSNFDVRSRFTANAVIDSWWNVKGFVGYLVNGWELAPIFQAQTGLPYSLVTSGSAPGGASGSINGSGGATRLLETGRNTYRYPSTYVFDARLSKSFKIAEKVNIQVLAEAFNLANTLNITSINNTGYIIGGTSALPTLTYNSPFGSITNANSNFVYSTRQVQIGAKLSF